MSRLKTATSALTAAVLVTGIGLAWAQTSEQTQPMEPTTDSTAAPVSEQTPADPNALTPVDSNAASQQALPANDPARTTPPVDSSASNDGSTLNAGRNVNANTTAISDDMSARSATPGSDVEPTPRADRN